jgi:hypothetical protein
MPRSTSASISISGFGPYLVDSASIQATRPLPHADPAFSEELAGGLNLVVTLPITEPCRLQPMRVRSPHASVSSLVCSA